MMKQNYFQLNEKLKGKDIPNVTKIYEVEESANYYIIIMKLYEKGTLDDILNEYIKRNRKKDGYSMQKLMKNLQWK